MLISGEPLKYVNTEDWYIPSKQIYYIITWLIVKILIMKLDVNIPSRT